jgi:hypothetical protein
MWKIWLAKNYGWDEKLSSKCWMKKDENPILNFYIQIMDDNPPLR